MSDQMKGVVLQVIYADSGASEVMTMFSAIRALEAVRSPFAVRYNGSIIELVALA